MSTAVFRYTGAQQTFVVPAGVTSLDVLLWGALGGAYNGGSKGGRVQGTLAVTPGETLYINIGGNGHSGTQSPANAGGWNGGGAGGVGHLGGGTGGGGAVDLRQGGTALSNRKAVAGAGAGRSAVHYGAHGGAATGANGDGSNGGYGGTQSAGGAVHNPGGGGGPTAGASGVGGHGGGNTVSYGGGGGGGGYYGGAGGGLDSGSGANYSSGGGGSNYVGGLTAVTHNDRGVSTAYGSAVLTYNQLPNAPTLVSPPSGAYLDRTVIQTFGWNFSDPDLNEYQLSADFQYRTPPGSGAWTTITGAAGQGVEAWSAAANLFTLAAVYEWQVRTYDHLNVVGPWSASSTFTATAPPAAPTWVTPFGAGTVIVSPNPIEWSTTGGTQLTYQVQQIGDLAGSPDPTNVIADTGTVTSASHTPSLVPPAQGQYFYYQVRWAINSGIWSAWTVSARLQVNLSPPDVPTVALTRDETNGIIHVAITNPAGNGTTTFATVTNDVYRTDLSVPGQPEILVATNVAPSTTVDDYTPASGRQYQYRIVAWSTSGAYQSSTATYTTTMTLTRCIVQDTAYPPVVSLTGLGSGGQRLTGVKQDSTTRVYASGRVRSIVRTTGSRSLSLTLRLLTPTQLAQLEAWCAAGTVVLFRDTYGQAVYGTFSEVAETYIPLSGRLVDAAIVLSQVTAPSAVIGLSGGI